MPSSLPGSDHAIADIEPDDVPAGYERLGIGVWSDARLAHAAGVVVSRPKVAPADSFVLHAPLELMGRLALLRHVATPQRDVARHWIVFLAATYARAGAELPDPPLDVDLDAPTAAARLGKALDAADLDEVDRATVALAATASPRDIPALLGDAVIDRLTAAAHAPILLDQLARYADASEVPLAVLREPARELGRHPEALVRWHRSLAETTDVDRTGELASALLATPLDRCGGRFIWPSMADAEDRGVPQALLTDVLSGPVDIALATRQVLAVAAHSMLQDSADAAAYGWTHCLTMPLAALRLAPVVGARRAVAVAAHYVIGFRRDRGVLVPDPGFVPEPSTAAGAAWHTPAADRPELVSRLATTAATHHDSHVVKYAQSCIDAAAADVALAPVLLAALAHLLDHWATRR